MIYTKTGDLGTTSLIGGTRVEKCHPRVEAYGTVDELGAHLALRQLFTIQTLLALEPNPPHPTSIDVDSYSSQLTAHCSMVEQAIDNLQATLPPFRGFTIPGGNAISAQCHVARTVCRRAERRIVQLYTDQPDSSNPSLLSYINRLSDYLYVLSRHLVLAMGNEECFL